MTIWYNQQHTLWCLKHTVSKLSWYHDIYCVILCQTKAVLRIRFYRVWCQFPAIPHKYDIKIHKHTWARCMLGRNDISVIMLPSMSWPEVGCGFCGLCSGFMRNSVPILFLLLLGWIRLLGSIILGESWEKLLECWLGHPCNGESSSFGNIWMTLTIEVFLMVSG
jgi:hypothetical protein